MPKMSCIQPKTEHDPMYRPKDVLSEEIRICMECTRPASKCKGEYERFKKKLREIKRGN